jgi:hypothetical protein
MLYRAKHKRMSKERWVRQKDKRSCGVIAALNARKMLGIPTSRKKHYKSAAKAIFKNKTCWLPKLRKYLRQYGKVFRIKLGPKTFRHILDLGLPIIIVTPVSDLPHGTGHVALVSNYKGKHFEIVNGYCNLTPTIVTERFLWKEYFEHDGKYGPVAYTVFPKEPPKRTKHLYYA